MKRLFVILISLAFLAGCSKPEKDHCGCETCHCGPGCICHKTDDEALKCGCGCLH